MYVFMGHMKPEHTEPYERNFWEKNRIDLLQDTVIEIKEDRKEIITSSGALLGYDRLVLATGSKPRRLSCEGFDLSGVQGFYSWQDLESLESAADTTLQSAVVVGGGLIGIECVEMLLSKGVQVTYLVRETHFWGNVLSAAESELIHKKIKEHGVRLLLETEVHQIIGNEKNEVTSVITGSGERMDCQLVLEAIGVVPNVDFLRESNLKINKGILVNSFLETNVKDVYAIGDCAEFVQHPHYGRPHIDQVWYTGKMMGKHLAHCLCKNREVYQPTRWFNSAKFFDVEYQNYGIVPNAAKDKVRSFFWKHPSKEVQITLAYDVSNLTLMGINSFGMRWRHEVFDRWMNEEWSIEKVLIHLKEANFDPEFFGSYEGMILAEYNRQFSKNLKLKKRSFFQIRK